VDPQRHIVIIGPMGSGKTTIGRLLAHRMVRPFVDNDTVLEQSSGHTAAEIARSDGVDALHAREAAVLGDALDARQPAVLTAAASTVDDPELRDRLRSDAFVIWLTAEPRTLAHRTTGSVTRPRLSSDPLTLAEQQRLERDPLFAEVADLLVATDGTVETVVDDVIANLPDRA
jgi:shikimate kinase